MNKQELLQAANMCCLIYWQGMRRLTMMKYKAGDKVRIRKDLTVYGDYGYVADVVPPMLRYAGKVAFIKVSCEYDGTYKIDIDDQQWWWSDEMFEDKSMEVQEIALERLEEIEKPYGWLKVGTAYYCADITSENLCEQQIYDADRWDKRYMERGIVFKTREEAIECAKKMLAAIKQEG